MVSKTYIEYFADLFTLRRNLSSMILKFEKKKKFQSISEAFNIHSNEMDAMDLRLDLLYDHRKKLSAQTLNSDSHHRILHFEITNSRKVFKLFSKIEKEKKHIQHVFNKEAVIRKKKMNCLRKYWQALEAIYKTYDKKCNSMYAKWKFRNSKVCLKIDRLMDEFQQKASELQGNTEKMCENLDYNGIKNMVFECETIIEKSLLKVKSTIRFNLFKMKVFICQQKSSKKSHEIMKEKKPIQNRKRLPQKGKKYEKMTEMRMAENIYQCICGKFSMLNSIRDLLLPINWKFRKKMLKF